MTQANVTWASRSEGIRERLREQVLSGELAMGQRLTEQGIAERMGTSAGPVREAFASLTNEGLLISLPHRGTFVSSVSKEEARGAYGIRHRLEPYAFELTAGRLSPEIIAKLEATLDQFREAARAQDYATLIGLDMRFHGIFYTESGNTALAAIWPILEGTIRKFIAVAGPQYDPDYKRLIRQHETLLKDVKSGDLRSVNAELATHGQDIWRNLPPENPTGAAPRPRKRSR